MGNYELRLSQRLSTVAHMIEPGSIVADIGTDHGYLPIYLIKNNIAPHVIAMDVNAGPLDKARKNAAAYNVADKLTLRISDGLKELSEQPDVVTICGMGGRLICRILTEGYDKLAGVKKLIVSPQSDLPFFREYMADRGFAITAEKLVLDEGKYYFIFECEVTGNKIDIGSGIHKDVYLRYGRLLRQEQNPLLKQLMDKEYGQFTRIKQNVMSCDSENSVARIRELDYELECIEKGLETYDLQTDN